MKQSETANEQDLQAIAQEMHALTEEVRYHAEKYYTYDAPEITDET